MKSIKKSAKYIEQYHPARIDPSKLRLAFYGDRAWYIREFMSTYGLKTTREFVKYVTRFVKEFEPPVVHYTYTKENNIRADGRNLQWKCNLEDAEDVETFAIINYYFENGDSDTRLNTLYNMFCAVRKHLRSMEKADMSIMSETLTSTKKRWVNKDIGKLRVGERMEYHPSMFMAQAALDKWMEKNIETGNRYVLFEENNKVHIYREL
jgi:hypothetical protein